MLLSSAIACEHARYVILTSYAAPLYASCCHTLSQSLFPLPNSGRPLTNRRRAYWRFAALPHLPHGMWYDAGGRWGGFWDWTNGALHLLSAFYVHIPTTDGWTDCRCSDAVRYVDGRNDAGGRATPPYTSLLSATSLQPLHLSPPPGASCLAMVEQRWRMKTTAAGDVAPVTAHAQYTADKQHATPTLSFQSARWRPFPARLCRRDGVVLLALLACWKISAALEEESAHGMRLFAAPLANALAAAALLSCHWTFAETVTGGRWRHFLLYIFMHCWANQRGGRRAAHS